MLIGVNTRLGGGVAFRRREFLNLECHGRSGVFSTYSFKKLKLFFCWSASSVTGFNRGTALSWLSLLMICLLRETGLVGAIASKNIFTLEVCTLIISSKIRDLSYDWIHSAQIDSTFLPSTLSTNYDLISSHSKVLSFFLLFFSA